MTQSSVNLAKRGPYVIRQIVYEREEQDRNSDLGPIPGAHHIALGLDLRLGRLKLLVKWA